MEGYRFTFPLKVRVSDLNYAGHVGNAKVLDYFQEARVAYLDHLGGYSELDIGGPGIILPEAQVFYRGEMFAEDDLLVGVRCCSIKNSSFRLEYRIERVDQLTAEGFTSLVAFDYQQRKPVRLPDKFKQRLSSAGQA